MRRTNIDGVRFLDMDMFWYVEIVPHQIIGDDMIVRGGYRVDGVTADNQRVEKLFADIQSGTTKLCEKWVLDNWLGVKK